MFALNTVLRNRLFDSEMMNDIVRTNQMRSRLIETGTGYELKIVLPGFDAGEVHLEYLDSTLTVRAEKSEDCKTNQEAVLFDNFGIGTVSRSFDIPDLDIDKCSARLKDGILTVNLVKVAQEKPKRINITV